GGLSLKHPVTRPTLGKHAPPAGSFVCRARRLLLACRILGSRGSAIALARHFGRATLGKVGSERSGFLWWSCGHFAAPDDKMSAGREMDFNAGVLHTGRRGGPKGTSDICVPEIMRTSHFLFPCILPHSG